MVVTPDPREYCSSWVEISSKSGLFLNARTFESKSVERVAALWLRNLSDFLLRYRLKKVFVTNKTMATAPRIVTWCCGLKPSIFKKFKSEVVRFPGFSDWMPLIANAPITPTRKTPNKSKIPNADWNTMRQRNLSLSRADKNEMYFSVRAWNLKIPVSGPGVIAVLHLVLP